MSKRAKTNDASDGSKRAKANDANDGDYAGYAARASAAITDTEIDDLILTITSHQSNARILRQFKNNDPSFTRLDLRSARPFAMSPCEYSVEGCSLGWLGHFVGESTRIKTLSLDHMRGPDDNDVFRDELLAFFRGLNQNRSVQHLSILDLGALSAELPALSQFFAENKNLVSVAVSSFNGHLDGSTAHQLSRTLRSCTSLKSFAFELEEMFAEREDEHVVEIIKSLSKKPNLEEVSFPNCLGRGGHRALEDLLAWEGCQVKSLDVRFNEIDAEDFERLLNAVASNGKLQKLNMQSCFVRGEYYDDQAIFALIRAWGSVERPLLKAFASNLVELDITMDEEGSMDDEEAIAFAHALTGNLKLKVLKADWQQLTSRGWNALSKLLCDTSSPNATFASNHTLQDLGPLVEARNANIVPPMFLSEIVSLLALNRNNNKSRVASAKILKTHDDFDMQVLFEWEFKMLPIAIQWLSEAAVPMVSNPLINPNIQRRKLSTIYQFARGAPKSFIEYRLRGELEEIGARDERILREQERMSQELDWLQERKITIYNKLRGK